MDRVDRDGDALMYSIMWRIMPLMVALMMLSVIDRSNVSYAKLQTFFEVVLNKPTIIAVH